MIEPYPSPLWSGQQSSCACDCRNGNGNEEELERSGKRAIFELVDGRKQRESDEADGENVEDGPHLGPGRGVPYFVRGREGALRHSPLLLLMGYPVCYRFLIHYGRKNGLSGEPRPSERDRRPALRRTLQLLRGREVEQRWAAVEELLFAVNSAEQLLAVVPLADFIIFRNYVSVTEGMQEPA
jgi:hypothetical protein